MNFKRLNLCYSGFCNTHFLWEDDKIKGLQQFQLPEIQHKQFSQSIDKYLRLGKLAERFVFEELSTIEGLEILSESLQIQDGKRTVGELDGLIIYKNQPIHLEIVYKFYLYDDTVGATEIDHWIGPNRKDSFTQKLEKLTQKQLPLLYTSLCETALTRFNLLPKDFVQQVYFKAQLFVPISKRNIILKQVNSACIVGMYINRNEFETLSECKFFIPEKVDWLLAIETQIHWKIFEQISTEINRLLDEEIAPLCWVKYPNGETEKCFVVWW